MAYLVQLQSPHGVWLDVGLLRERNNTNWFESFDTYWNLPDRPVLGQVFEENGPSWRPSARVSLPHWFSHLLPEGQLRAAVSRVSGVNSRQELPLLALLGAEDLPGALRVVKDSQPRSSRSPQANDYHEDEHAEDPVLKFSLAGMQLKFSLRQTDRGLTLPASGKAGNLIVKLPDPRPSYSGVPEAEYAAMSLARAAGFSVPRMELLDTRSIDVLGAWSKDLAGRSFAIARYDRRPDGRRIHAEEFAQILNISAHKQDAKYRYANFESIANVASNLVGPDAVGEVIRRLVLNVLVGNGDAHLKNWSVIYPDGQRPELSPLYDVVPTVLYLKEDNLGLNLNRSKSFADVSPSSFRRIGEVTGIGGTAAESIARQATEQILVHWPVLAEILPQEQRARLNKRLHTLALVN